MEAVQDDCHEEVQEDLTDKQDVRYEKRQRSPVASTSHSSALAGHNVLVGWAVITLKHNGVLIHESVHDLVPALSGRAPHHCQEGIREGLEVCVFVQGIVKHNSTEQIHAHYGIEDH
jgi:hypothetical protein